MLAPRSLLPKLIASQVAPAGLLAAMFVLSCLSKNYDSCHKSSDARLVAISHSPEVKSLLGFSS